MPAWNVAPNEVTYTALIRGMSQEGCAPCRLPVTAVYAPTTPEHQPPPPSSPIPSLLAHAVALLREMRAHGIMPNLRTYNTLLRGCWRCGEVDLARWLFADMQRPCTPAATGTERAGDDDGGSNPVSEGEEEAEGSCSFGRNADGSISPDTSSYEYLARCLSQHMLVDEAATLLAKLDTCATAQAAGKGMAVRLERSAPAYAALATSAALAGRVTLAERALSEAQRSHCRE